MPFWTSWSWLLSVGTLWMLRANEGALYGAVSRPPVRPASGGAHTLAAAVAARKAVAVAVAAGRLAMHRRIVMLCA